MAVSKCPPQREGTQVVTVLPSIVQAICSTVVAASILLAVDDLGSDFFPDVSRDVTSVDIFPVVADTAIIVLDLLTTDRVLFGCSLHLTIS